MSNGCATMRTESPKRLHLSRTTFSAVWRFKQIRHRIAPQGIAFDHYPFRPDAKLPDHLPPIAQPDAFHIGGDFKFQPTPPFLGRCQGGVVKQFVSAPLVHRRSQSSNL